MLYTSCVGKQAEAAVLQCLACADRVVLVVLSYTELMSHPMCNFVYVYVRVQAEDAEPFLEWLLPAYKLLPEDCLLKARTAFVLGRPTTSSEHMCSGEFPIASLKPW